MFNEFDDGLDTIQDLRRFKTLLCEVAEEYMKERECYHDPVLVVYYHNSGVKAEICERNDIGDEISGDKEIYPISVFVNGDDIDYDELDDIASKWVFVR